jgi:integrase
LIKAGVAYLAYLDRSGAYAPATLAHHRAVLRAASLILGDAARPGDLTREDAMRVRDRLLAMPRHWERRPDPLAPAPKRSARLSPYTVTAHLTALARFFDWLQAEGKVYGQANPFKGLALPHPPHRGKRAPTFAEAEALCALPRPSKFDPATWIAMPRIARYAAMRAGEIAQLEGADVQDHEGLLCISVVEHGPQRLKTRGSRRLIPVADRLRPTLDALLSLRQAGPLLRAEAFQYRAAHEFLKHYNRRAKKVAPDLSFHCLRVYANDAMATAAVDILDRERLLGHKSERVQAAYTPANLHRLQAAVNTIP